MSIQNTIRGILSRNVRLFWYDEDADVDREAKIDQANSGLIVMQALHTRTHEGVVYEVQALAPAVAAGGVLELLLQNQPRFAVHCRPIFISEGPSEARIFEAPTFSGSGSAKTPVNRNRRAYAGPANTVASEGPTLTDDGTELSLVPIFSATGPGQTSTGGSSNGFEEWLLEADEDYLFRLTNTHASTAFDLWVSLTFYEQELQL